MAQFLLESVNDKSRSVKRVFIVEADSLDDAVSHWLSVVKYRNPPVTQVEYLGTPAIIDPVAIGLRILEL